MTSLSKSFRLSSTLKIEEEAMFINKNQGIGSILGSDVSDERSTNNKSSSSSSSLRRTLSADMSSNKWLTQQGFFSPMKKTASSEEFSISSITDSSSSSEDEVDAETESRSQFDIWNSIQEEKKKQQQQLDVKPGQFDIWSSIIQQKSQDMVDNKPLPPPYIHPLVKRSSSLSEKSLQICTESLGSETGSDGFSSYPSSESGDVIDDEKEPEPEHQPERVGQSFEHFEEVFIPKYNYYVAAAAKKSPQRSFPPPIPSCRDGACIRMQPRRDNGRLVLEIVSVPSTNNFLAHRHDGRLVLTFVNGISSKEIPRIEQVEEKKEMEELEEEFESFDDEDEESDESKEKTKEEDEEEEGPFVMEQATKLSSRLINMHRLTLKGLLNRNPITWPNKFNEVVKFDEVEEDVNPAIVAKSLPPMVRLIPKTSVAAAAGDGTVTATAVRRRGGGGGTSFNAYEYYWRPKPMTTTKSKYLENRNQEQQQLVVMRGNKGDYLDPLIKSCKESRRSLLFWEPNCIATS